MINHSALQLGILFLWVLVWHLISLSACLGAGVWEKCVVFPAFTGMVGWQVFSHTWLNRNQAYLMSFGQPWLCLNGPRPFKASKKFYKKYQINITIYSNQYYIHCFSFCYFSLHLCITKIKKKKKFRSIFELYCIAATSVID